MALTAVGTKKSMLWLMKNIYKLCLTELTFPGESYLNYYYNIRINMFINVKTGRLIISRLCDLKAKSFPSCVAGFFFRQTENFMT